MRLAGRHPRQPAAASAPRCRSAWIANIASEPCTDDQRADPGVAGLELEAGQAVRDGGRAGAAVALAGACPARRARRARGPARGRGSAASRTSRRRRAGCGRRRSADGVADRALLLGQQGVDRVQLEGRLGGGRHGLLQPVGRCGRRIVSNIQRRSQRRREVMTHGAVHRSRGQWPVRRASPGRSATRGRCGPRRRPRSPSPAGRRWRRASAAARAPSAGDRWPTHGSRVSVGVLPADQVGERAPGEVRRADAVADVAAGPAESRCRGRGRRTAYQSRGTPSGPPQVWVIASSAERGEQVVEHAPQLREDRGVAVVRRPRSRDPKWYGAPRPPNASRSSARALAVDDQVPVVGERLRARASPTWSQNCVGQRLGRDHQRVDGRDHVPAGAGQAGGVALGRAHHDAAPARPRARSAPAPAASEVARVPSWIVAPRRSTLRARPRTRRAGWIAAQCGVYVATEHVRRAELLASLGRVEQPQVLRPEAPGTPLVDLGCRAPQLHRRAGEHDGAALARSRQSIPRPPRPRRPRPPSTASRGTGRRAASRLRGGRHLLQRGREQRRAPAAVAPAGAEAGGLGLEHDHPQRRISAQQVVRRPQSGVAGPDDRDVGVVVDPPAVGAVVRRARRRAGPTTATAVGTGTPPPRSSGPPEQVVRQRVPVVRCRDRCSEHLAHREVPGPRGAQQVLLGVVGRTRGTPSRWPRRAAARAPAWRRAPCATVRGCPPTARAAGGR